MLVAADYGLDVVVKRMLDLGTAVDTTDVVSDTSTEGV